MDRQELPAGWLIRVSRSKSKVYYYNTTSGETQWTRPTSPAERSSKKQKTVVESESKDEDQSKAFASMRVGGSVKSASSLFTPWEHQVNAVSNIIKNVRQVSTTQHQKYLLQHSTGSGKSIVMAALAHQLLYVVDDSNHRFHTVILLFDRIKLDDQVGSTVERFLQRNGVNEVFRADSARHFASLIEADTSSTTPKQRVIITTIQKLATLVQDAVALTRLFHHTTNSDDASSFDRTAILTDEAHRSHSKTTREAIETVMQAGSNAKLTFVGFTATPNAASLELFGTEEDGWLHPFDCYSMSQAVQDKRILNVLQNYSCVHCHVETNLPSNVRASLQQKHLLRKVMDVASELDTCLKAKTLYMMEDYAQTKALHSRLKCMVVARSRRDVLRYYNFICRFLQNKGHDYKVYASFSGSQPYDTSDLNGKSVTEQSLNTCSLASADVVVVCDKLDTGYNDPMLASMYIDRVLKSSTQTVQLLSRLNRPAKGKTGTKVVDFANHVASIRMHFAKYWGHTRMPSSASGHSDETRRLEVITGSTVVNDQLPALADAATQEEVDDLVQDTIEPLERDRFQQIKDALDLCLNAWEFVQDAEDVSNVPRDQLRMLRKSISRVTSVDDDDFLQDILPKLSSRVQHRETTFHGNIDLHSLLHD